MRRVGRTTGCLKPLSVGAEGLSEGQGPGLARAGMGCDACVEFSFLPPRSLGACHTLAGSSLSSAFPQDEDVASTP